MSKKRPSPAEARWRANYRYRRELAKWKAEEAIGDPLGLAADMRKDGTLAKIAEAILVTGPGTSVERARELLRRVGDRAR